MRANRLGSVSLGVALGLAIAVATASADVTCKDGTTSTVTGRGACSHHGGVAKFATTPAAPSSGDVGPGGFAAAPPGAVTCKDGSQSKPGRGACSHHGGVATAAAPAPANEHAPSTTGAAASSRSGNSGGSRPADASGATAQCKDGTYSHSQHHSGACSHHGGVATWLDGRQ